MAETKKFFRISDISHQDVSAMYKAGFNKGYECGFYNGDRLMSFKLGYHTLLYGHPGSGKTQFIIEEMIYLSREFGIKHLIYLPENGRKEEVLGDLLMTYMAERRFGDDVQMVDIDKLNEAIAWMDKFFLILAPKDGVLTLKDAFNNVHIARAEGFDINMLWIDHFGYLSKEKDDRYFNIADYVRDSLQFVLRASLALNIHTVILAHIRDIDPVVDKDTGVKYMPRPHASEVAGGQQNWNNGYQMIAWWRCPQGGVIDPETGVPYLHNECRVMIHKSKPKGIGRLGEFAIIFDETKQKFYEIINDGKYYVGEYKKQTADHRLPFGNDDLPF